jgi:hypothetical protein
MTMSDHIVDGEFQSDKYPTCPRGRVPLSVRDATAQDLLWEYARRRRTVDAGFSDDLEACLQAAGFVPAQRADTPHLSQGLTPEVLRGFRAMACALTAPQAEHPDVRAACKWLDADSAPAEDQAALNSRSLLDTFLTPEQRATLSHYFHMDTGEFQSGVIRGDEDGRLTEMIDAFDAFFMMCRAQLGHAHVPIGIWETYTMLKSRHVQTTAVTNDL